MEKLGATGDFPEGKICDDDEGGIKMAMAADKERGVIFLDFGKAVTWIAFSKADALRIAQLLVDRAGEL